MTGAVRLISRAPAAGALVRAASVLHVRAADDAKREITGIATTPRVDRMQDVVDPRGLKFKNPLPLLLYHDHRQPVGHAWFSAATDNGVSFRASLPHVAEPGTLKDRVDLAWHSIKYDLLAGVSIGFRTLPGGQELMSTGGVKFTSAEVIELSLCTVPANPDAEITGIRSIDTQLRNEVALAGANTRDLSGWARKRVDAYARAMGWRETDLQRPVTRAQLLQSFAGLIERLERDRAENNARLSRVERALPAGCVKLLPSR